MPYLLGQIGLVGNKFPIANNFARELSSLPIRSNRISWKRFRLNNLIQPDRALPIRSNRISWKPKNITVITRKACPYLLGQIGLVGNRPGFADSWARILPVPYLLGQIGLVGNETESPDTLTDLPLQPYLLGQIGLVGKQKKGFF